MPKLKRKPEEEDISVSGSSSGSSDDDGEEVASPSASSSENSDDSSQDEGESIDEEEEMNFVNLSQPIQPESADPVTSVRTFADLGLGKWLCDQMAHLEMKRPTPVQINCIPAALNGRDVLGCAKTGTGKTLAFALPMLQQLATDPYGIFGLILTPTRELAFQIADQFIALGKPIGLKTAIIVGGRDQMAQAQDMAKRPHIVIATPGRLADHIDSATVEMSGLFDKMVFLVLDEADRLLDGQYGGQLKVIFGIIPKKRQTLLFSATLTDALQHLHQVSVRKPYFFEDKSEIATVEQLEQKYVLCPVAVKDAYLVYVVKNFHQKRPQSSILIFSHTCRECQALAIMFNGLGFKVGSLHSQISQADRLAALSRFRSGRCRILICTDVAARGLDIAHVDLVVNHNVPRCPKTYVHRVGRSARAGRIGGAVTFVTQYDIGLIQAVEKLVGKKLDQLKVDDKKVTQYVTQVLVAKREAEIRLEKQNFGERKEINKRKEMLMSGLDVEEVDRAMDEMRTRRKDDGKKSRMTGSRSSQPDGKKRKKKNT